MKRYLKEFTTQSDYESLKDLLNRPHIVHFTNSDEIIYVKSYLPKPNLFYCIKSLENNRYLTNQLDTNNPKTLMTSESINSNTIYYLESDLNGKLYLISYANGYYIANSLNIGIGTNIISDTDVYKLYFIIEEDINGECTIQYKDSNVYLKVDGQKTNDTTNKDDNTKWIFEPITSLPVTFKAAALGFMSFNSPVAIKLPNDISAYIAKLNDSDASLKTFKITNQIIPANTAIMLYKDNLTEDEIVYLELINENVPDDENIKAVNDFVGTIAAETYPSDYTVYSLQKNSTTGEMGYYKKTSGNLAGFKAWIKIPK